MYIYKYIHVYNCIVLIRECMSCWKGIPTHVHIHTCIPLSCTVLLIREGQRVYKSLEVLEAWVSEVRHLMSEEPQRMLDGKSHPPSLIEVQE